MEALLQNPEAGNLEVHVFSDAASNQKDAEAVQEVRDYLKKLRAFGKLSLHFAEKNKGLAQSILEGVTSILQDNDGIIVLEDDMEVQPFFLRYMTDGLNKYRDQVEVCSIHAYTYPIDRLPETFFIKGADCWGWATWKRAWELFTPDAVKLLEELKRRKLTREFDFNGNYPYTRMLERRVKGENQSWAVLWYASMFLQDKLTLYPNKSLLRNTGNDGSGTHSHATSVFDPVLADHIPVLTDEIRHSEKAYLAFAHFLGSARRHAIRNKIAGWFGITLKT